MLYLLTNCIYIYPHFHCKLANLSMPQNTEKFSLFLELVIFSTKKKGKLHRCVINWFWLLYMLCSNDWHMKSGSMGLLFIKVWHILYEEWTTSISTLELVSNGLAFMFVCLFFIRNCYFVLFVSHKLFCVQGMKLLPTGRKNFFYLAIYGSLVNTCMLFLFVSETVFGIHW